MPSQSGSIPGAGKRRPGQFGKFQAVGQQGHIGHLAVRVRGGRFHCDGLPELKLTRIRGNDERNPGWIVWRRDDSYRNCFCILEIRAQIVVAQVIHRDAEQINAGKVGEIEIA